MCSNVFQQFHVFNSVLFMYSSVSSVVSQPLVCMCVCDMSSLLGARLHFLLYRSEEYGILLLGGVVLMPLQ